jgi:DNA-binding NarL/FixJ family response regulator
MDGIEATRRLAGPDVAEPLPIVIITTFDLDEYVHGLSKPAPADSSSRTPDQPCSRRPSTPPPRETR